MSEQQTREQIAEQLFEALYESQDFDGINRAESMPLILSALSSVRRQEEEKTESLPGTTGPADSGCHAPVAAWLPIETLPPDKTDNFLVWCPENRNTYLVVHRLGQFYVFGGGLRSLDETPTHWCERPQPPGVDGGEPTITPEKSKPATPESSSASVRAEEELTVDFKDGVWFTVKAEGANLPAERAEGEPERQEPHDYSGDPKHCHACAIRAFVNAELRTRSVEQERDALRKERDTMADRLGTAEGLVELLRNRAEQAESQLATLTAERDKAIQARDDERARCQATYKAQAEQLATSRAEAFRAGFLARLEGKPVEWVFSAGGTADDMVPHAYAAWLRSLTQPQPRQEGR